jgi:hypothetical protein
MAAPHVVLNATFPPGARPRREDAGRLPAHDPKGASLSSALFHALALKSIVSSPHVT